MGNSTDGKASISIPDDFVFGEVTERPAHEKAMGMTQAAVVGPPDLGPLAFFRHAWVGNGFNTIFRPDNPVTPTLFPVAPPPADPKDNVLELNLTLENLTFSPSLGSVPNRGSGAQGDVFLNGVPYLQAVTDISDPVHPVGIHVEPGIWMIVPPTNVPVNGTTLVRMASIPHGTTIEAQGTSQPEAAGGPNIPAVDITPFLTQPPGTTTPPAKISFRSQTAALGDTRRVPQDLTAFMAAGTITQAFLNNPNAILQNIALSQTITKTIEINISTQPNQPPIIGGGTDNIAFLVGDANQPLPTAPNAQALQMNATFWIETVEQTITVPTYTPGQPALLIEGESTLPLQPRPVFSVTPPFALTAPTTLKVTSLQIQYSQMVFLNFATLTWPHCSVATLVPAQPVVVPAEAWTTGGV